MCSRRCATARTARASRWTDGGWPTRAFDTLGPGGEFSSRPRSFLQAIARAGIRGEERSFRSVQGDVAIAAKARPLVSLPQRSEFLDFRCRFRALPCDNDGV